MWVRGNTRFISRVKHDISRSFAALSCSTLEIIWYFRTPTYDSLFNTSLSYPNLETRKLQSIQARLMKIKIHFTTKLLENSL